MQVSIFLLIFIALLLAAVLLLVASNIRKSDRINRFRGRIENLEKRISLFRDIVNDGICTYDPESMSITSCNSAFTNWFAGSESEYGRMPIDLFCTAGSPYTVSDLKECVKKVAANTPVHFEWSAVTRDGNNLRFMVSAHAIDAGTDSDPIVFIFHDVTDRKHMGDELTRLAGILESIGEGVATADIDGNITFVNKRWADMHGYSQRDLIGKHIRIFHSDKQLQEDVEPFNEMVIRKKVHSGEVGHMHADGTLFPTHMTTTLISDQNGEPAGFTAMATDLCEQKKVEAALRSSEIKFRQLFSLMPEPITLADLAGRIFDVNEKFCDLSGYTRHEIIGKTPLDLGFDPDQRQEFINALTKSGEVNGFETGLTVKDGSRFAILLFARLIEIRGDFFTLTVLHDITDQRRLEKRLGEAEKMEAIGTLAGGIAHDFNNILSAILGYSELSLLKTDPASKVFNHLNNILKATNRARDLIRRILAVSRHDVQAKKPIRIEPIVDDVVGLMRASLPSLIDIRKNISKPEGKVMADQGQIHQVLMNLCTNAGQSMEENGGVLVLGVDEVNITSHAITTGSNLNPGKYVRITIRDTGCGIQEGVMKKIFDPYFTTKPRGNGTGLGLSVVQSIIQKHGGAITVSSMPKSGSTFTVYLPTIDVVGSPVNQIAKPDDKRLPKGSESILIADDETAIVETEGELLSRLGYRVKTAGSGKDALLLFKANPDHFDLVVSDMTMPDMAGDELAARLMNIRPDFPVVLCTGYTTRMNEEEARKKGIKAFLYKPVSITRLARTIREVLDAGEGSA
ncbi:MAG: PAS domain S-box protein [Deltaproteobacteria bacterium]|nr:PAS domain S-box protein [Deltaproteobacteria bacterium]